MKLSAERLKSIDWKQLGVNHGEKITLAVVGLVVVLILFTGTRWKTYQEKQPGDLLSNVQTQEEALTQATWPKSEQEIYTKRYDVRTVYDNSYSVVNAGNFKYPPGHPMFWPLHRQQEPIEEPQWLTVQYVLATAGNFVLELPPPGQEPVYDGAEALAEANNAGKAETRAEAILKQFETGGGPTQGGPEGVDGGYAPGNSPPRANRNPMPMGEMGDMGDMGDMADGDMGTGETGVVVNSRGVRFISVRGVYPLREQAKKILEARHDPRPINPRSLVLFKDFELQRQQAKPGPNPWSDDDKDWKSVDRTAMEEILTKAANYSEDVVDINDTDWVFTMPLPMRLTGRWIPYFVGHPKIKTLTEREIEIRRMLNEQLVQLEKEAKSTAEDSDLPGGFADFQRNLAGIQSDVAGDETQMRRLMSGMQEMYDPENPGAFQKEGYEGMTQGMLSQTPEYLLFRYLDFDVEPGQAYRYRVRLKVYNPHHDEPLENVASPKVVDGKYRETPWSKPTTVAVMPEDTKFFVEDITPPRGPNEPKAKVDFFQWLSDVGTTAHKELEVQKGQIIGQPKPKTKIEASGEEVVVDPKDEKMEVEVLRPFQSFKPEPIELTTNDAVVDLVAPPAKFQPREFHADLKIWDQRKEWQGVVKPLSQMLIVNEYGELENRNPLAQLQDHSLATVILEREYRDFEYLKDAGKDEAMGEDGMMGDEATMDDMNQQLYQAGGAGRGGKGGGGRSGKSAPGSAGRSSRGGSAGPGGGGRSANPLRRTRRRANNDA